MPPDIAFADAGVFADARAQHEIADLIRAVLGGLAPDAVPAGCNAVMLTALSGGRSGAHVFKVTPRNGCDPVRATPVMVIKISPRAEGERERDCYERFVRPYLPAECRADLLGFAAADDRTALCYAYVGDGGVPQTLTDRLAAGDLTSLEIVLSTVFERLRTSWYAAGQIEPEVDLARYYLDRYFDDGAAAAAEAQLLANAARYFGAGRGANGCAIGAVDFPSLCGALFRPAATRAYRSCILHGDLNTDNIIFDRGGACARLVDFQRAGRGHIYQDLVSLEASIRINHPSVDGFGDIFEIERCIARGERWGSADGYASGVSRIRQAARDIFGIDEDPGAYQFSVAAIGLRLMRATDLSDAARARISASALWAAKALVDGGRRGYGAGSRREP